MTREDVENIINSQIPDNTTRMVNPVKVRVAMNALADYSEDNGDGGDSIPFRKTTRPTTDGYMTTSTITTPFTEGSPFLIKIVGANTTTSPTLSADGSTAYDMKKPGGGDLAIGDLKKDGIYWIMPVVDGASNYYEVVAFTEGASKWGEITGTLEDQTDLKNKFDQYVPFAGFTKGDLLVADAIGELNPLPIGTTKQVLQVSDSGNLIWGAMNAGDMMKSVYDPTNQNADAFNYNNMSNLPWKYNGSSVYNISNMVGIGKNNPGFMLEVTKTLTHTSGSDRIAQVIGSFTPGNNDVSGYVQAMRTQLTLNGVDGYTINSLDGGIAAHDFALNFSGVASPITPPKFNGNIATLKVSSSQLRDAMTIHSYYGIFVGGSRQIQGTGALVQNEYGVTSLPSTSTKTNYYGFQTNISASAAALNNNVGFYTPAANVFGSGAANLYGFYVGKLEGATNNNFGVYVADNDSYFGGQVEAISFKGDGSQLSNVNAGWGDLTGTLEDQTDLMNYFDNKFDIAGYTRGSFFTVDSSGEIVELTGGTLGQSPVVDASGDLIWQNPFSLYGQDGSILGNRDVNMNGHDLSFSTSNKKRATIFSTGHVGFSDNDNDPVDSHLLNFRGGVSGAATIINILKVKSDYHANADFIIDMFGHEQFIRVDQLHVRYKENNTPLLDIKYRDASTNVELNGRDATGVMTSTNRSVFANQAVITELGFGLYMHPEFRFLMIRPTGSTTNPDVEMGAFGKLGQFKMWSTGNFTFGNKTNDYASAKVAIDSTSQGFLMPRMTDTNWSMIASKAEGLQAWDTVNHAQLWFDGTDTIGFRYNRSTNKFQGFDGTNWNDLN